MRLEYEVATLYNRFFQSLVGSAVHQIGIPAHSISTLGSLYFKSSTTNIQIIFQFRDLRATHVRGRAPVGGKTEAKQRRRAPGTRGRRVDQNSCPWEKRGERLGCSLK